MPHVVVHAPRSIEAGFARIRAGLDVPVGFPPEVLNEAEAAEPLPGPGSRRDARALPFVAIDPAGATDLDQALCIERRGDGYRVHYAIADVAAFVRPGGAVDDEARRRGVTLYSPDGRAPLHPPVLSEHRASLLPDGDKPALLWTIDLDQGGEPTGWHLERAMVRTRAAISYTGAQRRIDGGPDGAGPPARADGDGEASVAESLGLLAEVGRLRLAREADRGGISLNLPAQTIVERPGGYELSFDRPLPVESWNAQISLLTGIVAGRTMVEAGVGLLRTLPAPQPDAIDRLRQTARALHLSWPRELPYAEFVRRLDGGTTTASAFLLQAARTLRGAGYVGFDGTVPAHPEHGAIASVYAHVTAPLRRLVDRFGNEILLAVLAGQRPPAWALEALDELPEVMGRARQRESALERALVDYAEAVVLATSVGRHFTGVVVDVGRNGDRAQVQIAEPAVVATVEGAGWQLAQEVQVELMAADPATGTIRFDPVP